MYIAGACILSSNCAKSQPQRVAEKPIPVEATPTPATATAQSAPNLPPPDPTEVKHAIERVFKGAVSILTDRNPYFITGDFNGDSSQDLAVVVKPTPGKILEINDELASWTIVDPFPRPKSASKKVPYPELHAEMISRRRALVSDGDILLAVLHGFESKGWRDSQATQAYMLRGASGGKIETKARKQIVWAGNEDKLPRIWGDVIAQTIGERDGFLYYNGAKYGWYDPHTYKPESVRMVHGRVSSAMR